jgi:hypothetical protein
MTIGWLEPLDWQPPAGHDMRRDPMLVWTSDTELSMFWFAADGGQDGLWRKGYTIADGVLAPVPDDLHYVFDCPWGDDIEYAEIASNGDLILTHRDDRNPFRSHTQSRIRADAGYNAGSNLPVPTLDGYIGPTLTGYVSCLNHIYNAVEETSGHITLYQYNSFADTPDDGTPVAVFPMYQWVSPLQTAGGCVVLFGEQDDGDHVARIFTFNTAGDLIITRTINFQTDVTITPPPFDFGVWFELFEEPVDSGLAPDLYWLTRDEQSDPGGDINRYIGVRLRGNIVDVMAVVDGVQGMNTVAAVGFGGGIFYYTVEHLYGGPTHYHYMTPDGEDTVSEYLVPADLRNFHSRPGGTAITSGTDEAPFDEHVLSVYLNPPIALPVISGAWVKDDRRFW